ncbi:MAG: sugar ABC transporter permease [Chloroflexi bacterium]|nr:sugar ABC transporter permease [Chloroflexota bacterium]
MKYLLIAPPLAFFFAISLIPLVYTVWLSLTSTNIAGGGGWVGFDNYARLLADTFFRQAYGNTVLFVVIGVAAQYVLGLALALAVHSLTRGQRLVRLAILLPLMIAPLIVGFIWQTLLDSRYGPVNGLLRAVGIDPVAWLTDSSFAFISILIVDAWQWTPFVFLVLYAGLRTLPTEPFEAARVDGASGWRTFADITFPMLIPASIAAILLRAIEAFKLFDIVFYITGGGPGGATGTVSLLGYFTALRSGNMGYGAAMTVVLLLTVIAIALTSLLILQRALSRPDLSGEQAFARRQSRTREVEHG